jgi:hypothetical protein
MKICGGEIASLTQCIHIQDEQVAALKLKQPLTTHFLQHPVGGDGGNADAMTNILLSKRELASADLYQPYTVRASVQFAEDAMPVSYRIAYSIAVPIQRLVAHPIQPDSSALQPLQLPT